MSKPVDKKPVVMYVDDIKANLVLFEASFEPYFTVLLAETGKEALKLLEENQVEVVVTDQNMPGMTGNDLLEIISVEYPDIMRFMITAYTDYNTVVDAVNKGQIYGYFNKPYDVDEVRISIEKALEVRRLRIANQQMIKELERANASLRALDKSKTKLLKSITDEIRSPINRIMTAIHMIKDKVDSRDLTDHLHLLDNSVRRLESFTRATKQLVDLGDGESGIILKEASLAELVEIAIIEKREAFKEAQITCKVENQAEKPVVNIDYDLVLSCIITLLEYITYHVRTGADLLLRIRNNEQGMILDIKINKEFFPSRIVSGIHLVSGTEGVASETDAGLELVLAKQIMHVHGGLIEVSEEDSKLTLSLIFRDNRDNSLH